MVGRGWAHQCLKWCWRASERLLLALLELVLGSPPHRGAPGLPLALVQGTLPPSSRCFGRLLLLLGCRRSDRSLPSARGSAQWSVLSCAFTLNPGFIQDLAAGDPSAGSSCEFPFPATPTFPSRSQLVLQHHRGTLVSSGVSHPARVGAGAGCFVPRWCAAPLGHPSMGWHRRSDPERAQKGTPMGGEPWSTLQVNSPGFQAQDSSRSNFSGLLLGVLFVLRPKTPGGPRWLRHVAISLLASDRGRLLNPAQLPGTRGVSVHQLCSSFLKKWPHTRVFSAS